MGLGDSVKDLYFHLEDKYYEVLDKISTKIPVNKVTDAIDKVFPSFALLLLIIVLLLIYFSLNLFPAFAIKEGIFSLIVLDSDRNPLPGANIEIIYQNNTFNFESNEEGTIDDFSVIVGTSINSITVKKTGYKPKLPLTAEITNIKIDKEKTEQKFILEEIITTEEVTFNIVDAETQQLLSGKNATVSFRCSNSNATPPSPMTVTNGTATVTVSKDCGILSADVWVSGYDSRNGVTITNGITIRLDGDEEPEPDKIYGKIIVDIYFKGQRVSDEITVDLYKFVDGAAEPISTGKNQKTTSGQATFTELEAGSYKIKSHSTDTLTGEETSTIIVNTGDTKTSSLFLAEKIIGKIKIKVIDKTSRKDIKDARITLLLEKTEVESGQTDDDGKYTFNLKTDTKYNLVIDKEEYCLRKIVDVEKGDDVKEFKLTKYTGLESQCGGAIIAKAQDEFGEPIQGATAMLFDGDGFYQGTKRLTDVNGKAKFTGIENGYFKVFAFKGYGNGWSDVKEYKIRDGLDEEFTVTMTIPKGTINVRVVDEDSEPVQYAFISARSAVTGDEIYKPVIIEREDGVISFEIIAGEPVYFQINDNEGDNATYISEPITVEPSAIKDVNFVLETKRISGQIESEFLGLFKNNKTVSIVGAGEEYTAKFKLSMPENADYDKVGFHIRTGYKNTMELDQIYIKEENVPGKPDTLRGTSFDEDEGINHDSQFLSADGSKWMNFEWDNHTKGVLYLEFQVRVKETAKADIELPLFWRAWGLDGTQTARDPIDNELGSSSSQNDLYAEAYKKTFQVGVETLCTDMWCYSARILDMEEDLAESVDETYSAKVGKIYKLDFSILNNSSSETDEFHDVQLKVFNPEETINFTDYSFAGELTVTGNTGTNETPDVSIGDLPLNREVKGTIYFTPKANIYSTISIRLHDPHRHEHIFTQNLSLELLAADEFSIEFEQEGEYVSTPPVLPSGTENELKVKVFRLRDGLEIENATVKLENKFGDVLSQTTTTTLGIAIITIPVLKPGEKLIIAIEKPDYKRFETEITVDNEILELTPEKVGFNLDVIEDLPDSKTITIENLSEMVLTVESIELQGDFDGLIDEEKAHEWLFSEYYGTLIGSKESFDIAVKTELSDLGLLSEEGKSLEGVINVKVSALGAEWVFPVDASISVGLGGEVDDPTCFQIDKDSWNAVIQEQQALTDILIINTCSVKGTPVDLKNLSAKIEWKSNRLGEMWLKVEDISVELRGGYPKTLRGQINKESDVDGALSFTPDGGIVGTAEATITLTAEHPTTGGKQILSDSLEVSIRVVNPAGCLRYNKDLIKIMEDETETLTIEATEDCGGPIDIVLDSQLPVSIEEFTIQKGETKEITVMANENYPGQYPIYVFAQGPGSREPAFAKLIRVIIDTDGCIKLNKYEYDLEECTGDQYIGFDTGKIINVCHSKVVNAEVYFSEKDMWKAFLNSWPFVIGGFLYGGFNAMGEGKTFWGTDKPGTICANAGAEYCAKGMMCQNDNIKKINNTICCGSSCVTGEEGESLHDEICGAKGYNYCGPGQCTGDLKAVKGVYCCKGKCEAEWELDAFIGICKDGGLKYCAADETCPGEETFYEGVRCCSEKCQTPEETPQMKICLDNGGLNYCDEVNLFCPDGSEEILKDKGLKCCNEECIKKPIYTCEEEETCSGTITVDGSCDVPCTPAEIILTEEDEICKAENPDYDFCENNEECITGNTETVGETECCTHMCTSSEDSAMYDLMCQEFGTNYHFCDEVTATCTGNIIVSGEIEINEVSFGGIPCCDQECSSMFDPDGGEELEFDNFGDMISDKDKICKDTSLGGNEFYDHCEAGEACFASVANLVAGINCCNHKCVDNTTRQDEYQAICQTAGLNYCNFLENACEEGNHVRLEAPGEPGNGGLPCCSAECIPNINPSNFFFNCDEGAVEEGAEPYCYTPLDRTYIKHTHADCSTYPVVDEECDRFYMCYNGACVFSENLSDQEKEEYCQSFDADGKSFHYREINNCIPSGMDPLNYTAPIEIQNGIPCCYTKGASTSGTTEITTSGTCASVQGYTTDCAEGFICKTASCGKCDKWAMLVPGIGYCCPTVEYSNYEKYKCYNPSNNALWTGETATASAPLGITGKNTACLDSGYGQWCSDGVCTECLLNEQGEETSCIPSYEPNGIEITVGSESFYCCPTTTTLSHFACSAVEASAPEEFGRMPIALATSGMFDIAGGLLGSVSDAINAFLGVDNPLEGAIAGALLGTAYNFFVVQEEDTYPYLTTVTDLNFAEDDVSVFFEVGLQEIAEDKILVEIGNTQVNPHPDWPLGIEETEIVFWNNGLEQSDPYKPVFRTMKVDGTSYDYNTFYEVETEEDATAMKQGEFLTILDEEGSEHKFHLQFNAYCPEKIPPKPIEEISCMIDGMTGSTGPGSLPNVKFRWDWTNIGVDTCDEDGEGIYCDATQFSIELLQKINKIDSLLRTQIFACPSSEGVLSEKTQDLDEDDLDVAITRVRVQKDGSNAKVLATLKSNNAKEMTVNAVLSLEDNAGIIIPCPEAPDGEKAVQLISTAEVECTFPDLDDGMYVAKIQINPQLSTCESECKNSNTGNDLIDTTLIVGGEGLFSKCEPYNTSRLAEYAAANPQNTALKEAIELTNFKANLIMDGYTNDFRADFHEFATTKDFFNTPSYYKGDAGLWKYFTDNELLEFESSFLRPESGYLRSGKYQVRINIEYDDDSWSLFDNAETNAKIVVKFDRLTHPDPDSPFYYMPFNGLIGVESQNGRQGYGVNYRQESLKEIRINEDPQQLIRTSTIAPSTPIPGAWIYTALSENFRTLNNDRRGVLLDIEHSATESSIILSPSNATPIIMKVSGGDTTKAWAFYSLAVDGEPQIVGSNLTSWTATVRGCKDFSDRELMETYMNRKDVHGGTTRADACAPMQRNSDYGLEWCDVARAGNVFLKTVFFTPQGTESVLEMTDSGDDAVFIAPATTGGKKVALTGIYSGDIDSVEKIFELVKAEDVCVAGLGNSAKMTFFWNPKMIMDKSLGSQIQNSVNECIQPE